MAIQAAVVIPIGSFSQDDLSGWYEKAFEGRTDYRLEETEQGKALCAYSDGSASGLYYRLEGDLMRTPYLHWSWRVDNILQGNDETTRQGDDYPARVYVIVSGGLLFWRTRSLVYVWSSHQPQGSLWTSAYTARVKTIAVRSGASETGQWLRERRNLRADFQRAFGKQIERIDAVAIMTDTDNTGAQASACYGDIYLSAS